MTDQDDDYGIELRKAAREYERRISAPDADAEDILADVAGAAGVNVNDLAREIGREGHR